MMTIFRNRSLDLRSVILLGSICTGVLLVAAAGAQTAPVANPDASVVGGTPAKASSPAELRNRAWTMLEEAVADDKHAETSIQALAAAGLTGNNPHAVKMIRGALSENNVDIRVAAVLAAGQTMAPGLTSSLRNALDDKEPAVAFAAALTLWKMHDHAGEDILMAVVDGDRGTSAHFVNGTEHTISKQLHDPAGMAKFGAMQGAYMLLGPFGYGLTAFEYLHKNGGDAARVSAIEAIAQYHTAPVRTELISALSDKDLGVRAAAAKALARYRDRDVPPALAVLFDDSKAPVRLTAAAAYLVSAGVAPGSPMAAQPAMGSAK
jgi:HEAT repeat protein